MPITLGSLPLPASTSRFGRRELNFARTRIDLLAAAMELAAENGLADIPVDEIARRAGVSRMTFFNRFPEKEALWFYFAWTWWFDNSVELHQTPMRGFAAIHRLFRRVAEADHYHRRFFRGFIGFIARMGEVRDLLEALRPGPAEKVLLHPTVPDAETIEILPMRKQLMRHLREAQEDGEIAADANLEALVIDLGVALYGEFLMAVVARTEDLWPRFKRQLDRILALEASAQSEALSDAGHDHGQDTNGGNDHE